MADIPLESAPFGNLDPRVLAHGFSLLEQPVRATPTGVLISPRARGVAPWLQFFELAASGFDREAFAREFVKIDARVDPTANLSLENRTEAKAAVRRWLDKNDFGQIASKLLKTSSPEERYLWLLEIVLPVFFEKYPGGRLGCVTYEAPMNGYLAFLNTLKKAEILHSGNPLILEKYAGRSAMSSFGLNVPAEMIWLMLSFVSACFFPESFAFVASCEHRYFLVFITDTPINMSQDEDRYPPIARLVPKLLSVLDAADAPLPLHLSERFVPAMRHHPFNRRIYNPSEILDMMEAYVGHVDGLLHWLCEATNFVAPDGQFDLDFALQTYLTVYALLNASYRIATNQIDMFSRKMGLFDVLELYAALVDCRGAAQTDAWKAHLEPKFISNLLTTLSRYPEPFDSDFVAATNDLLADNAKVVQRGLIYGRNADGSVKVPNKGDVPFDGFVVSLLRTLRNTKHGFKLRGDDYLAIHTGGISNDLPDYVVALWLNFVVDQSPYTLRH